MFINQTGTGGGAPMAGQVASPFDIAQQQGQYGVKQAEASAAPGMLAQQLKQSRFNTLLPMFSGAFGQQPFQIGGTSQGGPNINANPVWNAQQVQGQVNQAQAQGAQKVGSQTQQMQQGLAGRGFGGNSPLAQQLGSQFQMANNATQAQNEQATRWGAAQGNAQQQLQGQQAQEAQFGARQQESIERLKPYYTHQNALLAALSGLA